jgi:enoyl-[acyl-carrier-protein] reductase (NADH)
VHAIHEERNRLARVATALDAAAPLARVSRALGFRVVTANLIGAVTAAAVVHLARILSAELVDRGIRVNTLSPGPTDTAMFGRFPGEEQGEAVKDVLRTNNPSKRMADPLEIAKLAVYLASDDSAYVVGADFLIDGGVAAISAVGA